VATLYEDRAAGGTTNFGPLQRDRRLEFALQFDMCQVFILRQRKKILLKWYGTKSRLVEHTIGIGLVQVNLPKAN
jgi:hypothetical protein